MDAEPAPEPGKQGWESHSLFDFTDPEQAAKADPTARLSVEVLILMLREGGPLLPGMIREATSDGTIVLNGVRYTTQLAFKVARQVDLPPPPPPADPDVYRTT